MFGLWSYFPSSESISLEKLIKLTLTMDNQIMRLTQLSKVYDVVVFGGGYAGFAAARVLSGEGKEVLIIETQGAILWESGWAFFSEAGSSNNPAWQSWLQTLTDRAVAKDGLVDGASAEILATECIRDHAVDALYYVRPVEAAVESNFIQSVSLATKQGLRRVVARQWIDATETGELLRLLEPEWQGRIASYKKLNLYFALRKDRAPVAAALESAELPQVRLICAPTNIPHQQRLTLELPGDFAQPFQAWIPALKTFYARFPQELDSAVLTHGSVKPFPCYERARAPVSFQNLPLNVAVAVPSEANRDIQTLADRFELGADAARQLKSQKSGQATPDEFKKPAFTSTAKRISVDVVVAGTGTGGVLAALAAARQGQSVLAIELLPFGGGIGSGGGIHCYYYGYKGGLQDELDAKVRGMMDLFAKFTQLRGFHPDAKKIAIDILFHEAGVEFLTDSMLYEVHRTGSRVTHAFVATPEGPVEVVAKAWIDSTGDGDLAASGGASFSFGRESDGLLHAYTQSSGYVAFSDQRPQVKIVNYDTGYVDPTDPVDLTRARLKGILDYIQQDFSVQRPTYMAPALGIRQSRQIETDYKLTLADLIENKTFADSVGLTGSHYDNHAVDYEFESDEALFWVWVCRQWKTRIGCEIPYSILIPKGLDNVWIACRALGVTFEAHASMRTQRDMQRVGEVAGLAAALAIKHNCGSREIPFQTLRQQLAESGALSSKAMKPHSNTDSFGEDVVDQNVTKPTLIGANSEASAQSIKKWIEEISAGGVNSNLWHLYRNPRLAQPVMRDLLKSEDNLLSWRAAILLAMWKDPLAEARLCKAIENRETGFEREADPKARPELDKNLVPHWRVSIALLKRCGTGYCLPFLDEVASSANLLFNVRTAVALACEQVFATNLSETDKLLMAEVMDKLMATDAPNTLGYARRNTSVPENTLLTGTISNCPEALKKNVLQSENFQWQLQLVVARVREKLGVESSSDLQAFQDDPRALVRRSFTIAVRERNGLLIENDFDFANRASHVMTIPRSNF
jgi:glycine/D-amino acid oxidase-like deaminating enzyme